MHRMIPVLLLLGAGVSAASRSYIRLEQPTATTFDSTVGWSILSEKRALSLRPLPGREVLEAASAEYEFDVPDGGGDYTVWVRSYDHKWSTPATWCLDEGDKQEFVPLEVVNSAVESGCFRMDWQRLGTVQLTTGKHRFHIFVSGKRPQNDYPYFVLDVILLVKGGGYTPTGDGRPEQDLDQRTEKARQVLAGAELQTRESLLTRIADIRRRCLEEALGAVREFDTFAEEVSPAVTRQTFFREPLVAPLHGTVTQTLICDGQLMLGTEWNRAFVGAVWVGWVQNGALYGGGVHELLASCRLTVPIPGNLPNGQVDVHLVPLVRAVAAYPTATVLLPSALAEEKAVPSAWGVYRDGLDVLHPWHVSSGGMLLWEGSPYYPVGGMMNSAITWQTRAGEGDDTPLVRNALQLADRQLGTLAAYGLRDVFFNGCFVRMNPNAFNRLLNLAEKHGMRYGIHVSSMPEATSMGFHRSKDYVREAPKKALDVTVKIDVDAARARSEHRCLWGLVDADGELVESAVGVMRVCASAVEGKVGLELSIRLRKEAGEGGRVIFEPELPMSPREPSGYYVGIDRYIRRVHETYGQLKLGPNLRLWLDPFQNEMHSPFTSVCSDRRFQADYKADLSAKYAGDVAKLNEAWQPHGSSDHLLDFAVAARLVPIHRSASGYALIDPDKGTVYRFSGKRADCVRDLAEFRGRVCERFISRLADELKRIANVPVVLKHNVWFSDWFVNPRKAGGLDGVGFESYCYGDSLAFHNSLVAYSEALNAGRHQWSLVTETSPAAFDGQKDYVGYIDRLQLLHDMDLLTYYGAKGFYTFGFAFVSGPFKVTELLRDTRQLEWLHSHGEIISAASERLRDYRPEVYGWYPAYLHEQDVVGEQPRTYAMDGQYTGVSTQIRQAPDGRWIVPALRPDAEWHGLFVAAGLLTGKQAGDLATVDPTCPVFLLDQGRVSGTGETSPRAFLNGFTAHGIGVVSPVAPWLNLEQFRKNVLGYQVFQTRDMNGHTLPDGSIRLWTCVERTRGELVLPLDCEVRNLRGEAVQGEVRADGTQLVSLARPDYAQKTEDRPGYLTHGYYYPDMGQPEVVLVTGVDVTAILRLNAPARDRWLPSLVEPEDVLCWREGEEFVRTTFTQPRLEGYSRYSGGAAIGINTHFGPPDDQPFSAEYSLTTPACQDATLWLRRMVFPASAFRVELDGKDVGRLTPSGEMSGVMHLNPWSAGLGIANLQVGWCRGEVGPIEAGQHTLRVLVDPRSLETLSTIDTCLMGGDAAKRVGALKHGRSLRCIQVDALMLTR